MCSHELMELVYAGMPDATSCGHQHESAATTATAEPEHRESIVDRRVSRRRMMAGLSGVLGAAFVGSSVLRAQPAAAATLSAAVDRPGRKPTAGGRALLETGGRLADLTYTWSETFPVLTPFVVPPIIDHYATIASRGFNANKLTLDEHTGTHMDGPKHLNDNERVWTNEIPIENLVLPLRVIRIAERASKDPDTTLSISDIQLHERRYGTIPAGSFVAIDTGWGARLTKPGAYINRDSHGVPHFPGLSGDSATFLVKERGVFAAGTDTPSLDSGVHVNAGMPLAHRHLLGDYRYGVENIAKIETIPEVGAVVIVGASKHALGYAGPVRLTAVY